MEKNDKQFWVQPDGTKIPVETTGNKSASVTGYAQTDGERIKELEKWIVDCRDKILYPLAHEDTEIGRLAEGFGASTVKLLSA